MFVDFDPLYLVLLVFLINFLPGALFSFSILKDKKLFFVEKLFIGFAIGIILPVLLPFLLSFVGIPFSFSIALFSVLLFYLVSIYLAIKNKPWEDYKGSIPNNFSLSYLNHNRKISILLILILFLTFWLRIQSYSPIYYDLDPYFYLYSATQLITLGTQPLDDQTAWYPEVVVDHRNVPYLSYLESIWYSFYTSGGEYNNYLLALVASFYPPILAMLAMFFLYLFVSSVYKREFGLISASLASLIPILIMKLAGGEFEVQAYAFFSIAFFYALYALSIRNNGDLIYTLLASLALSAVYLGTGSIIVPISALIIFIPIYSIFLFFKENETNVLNFFKSNSIIFILGLALPTLILEIYKNAPRFGDSHYVIILTIIFSGILYLIKKNYWSKISSNINTLYKYSAAALLVILLLLVFTPVGSLVSGIAKGAVSIAQFKKPLDRTIQEQAPAGSDFTNMLGFIGAPFEEPFSYLFLIFSAPLNFIITFSVQISNSLLGTALSFSELSNSPMATILFLSIILIVFSIHRKIKGEEVLPLLFLAVIFPPTFVGILKAKYTIYAGFFISAALGLVLGELSVLLPKIIKRLSKDENKIVEYTKNTLLVLLLIGAVVPVMELVNHNPAPGVLLSSLQPRFQDDPLALQPKFQDFCDTLKSYGDYDADICLAAEDPIGYASQGPNYQFSQKLCIYSLVSSLTDVPIPEQQAFNFRCLRLNDYWIESMEWIKNYPDEGMRITSWWDYGHWINYFGEKNTVLRNEHASHTMIGNVAHNFLAGTPQELKEFMITHDSKYVMFDSELLLSGSGFGGKYGALNYLSCARNNKTDVGKGYMQSSCEWEQLWEVVYIPKTQDYYQECTISPMTGEKGTVAFTQSYFIDAYGNAVSSADATYCLGTTTIITGEQVPVLYYLNEKYENGNLKLNKGIMNPVGSDESFDIHHMLYSRDLMWVENGELKSGWEDRKGKFYDSNLYNGFVLKDLEGFELLFESEFSNIKIFKIK